MLSYNSESHQNIKKNVFADKFFTYKSVMIQIQWFAWILKSWEYPVKLIYHIDPNW